MAFPQRSPVDIELEKRKTAARARQHWLWRFSQQAVEIERASVHVDLAVSGARPFARRAVSVKLEPVLLEEKREILPGAVLLLGYLEEAKRDGAKAKKGPYFLRR
jgi:hypothetical protein